MNVLCVEGYIGDGTQCSDNKIQYTTFFDTTDLLNEFSRVAAFKGQPGTPHL